jgi:tetratricopeptide (TPR) repeat protein
MVLLFVTGVTRAQETIEELVQEGIYYHDDKQYGKAIEYYKKALEIDPKSTLANYELALSYFTKGDWEEAIKYSDIVLKQRKDNLLGAYMTKGSALDMLGRTKESIKLFEKALKKEGNHYLLYYNLAVNYYKLNDDINAEKNLLNALDVNNYHPSTHLMLARIHKARGNKSQTLLSLYFFLILEADTPRSIEANQMLMATLGQGVSKDPSKPNTINISFNPDKDNSFSPADLMISMMGAANSIEGNKEKTAEQLFQENSKSFFMTLGELKKQGKVGPYWNFYVPFFYRLAQSDHMEAFCNYITQSSNENAKAWIQSNNTKLEAFGTWLKG